MSKPKSKAAPAIEEVTPATPQAQWKRRGSSVYLESRAMIDGTDQLAHEMERKWGVDRLRLLVSDELRAAFDRQRLLFNGILAKGDLSDVERESKRMRNAWVALDAEATERGKERLLPTAWEIALPDGTLAVLVPSRADAGAILADGRRKVVYDLNEIANLIAGYPALVKAKQAWPGAQVTRIRPISDPVQDWEDSLDDMPF
ncbi:MAG: hypothetical protein H0U59_06755 [Gemmatimonadaceae bacterium]|nr:hypothetical protein [Gemmatimonadaceae bacterium]